MVRSMLRLILIVSLAASATFPYVIASAQTPVASPTPVAANDTNDRPLPSLAPIVESASDNAGYLETGTVTISATTGWQQTSFAVQQGETVEISYVSGSWTIDYRNYPYVGPEGYSPGADSQINPGCKYFPGEPYALLAGGVSGGIAYAVGRGGTLIADTSGYLFFRINDQDACLTDNAGSITLYISVGGSEEGADCYSTSGYFDVNPHEAAPGSPITISGDGTQFNGGWYEGLRVRFDLRDANGTWFYLGEGTVGCRNGRPWLEVRSTVPTNAAPGTAGIQATDSDGVVTGFMSLQIVAPRLSDLTVASITVTSDLCTDEDVDDGAGIWFKVDVKNIGNAETPASFEVLWSLPGGRSIGEPGSNEIRDRVPWLASGGRSVMDRTFSITSPGQYMLTVTADSQNEIQESNEINNTASYMITVQDCTQSDQPVQPGPSEPNQDFVTVRVPTWCLKLEISEKVVNTDCARATLNGTEGIKLDKGVFEFYNVPTTSAALRIYPHQSNTALYCDVTLDVKYHSSGIRQFIRPRTCTYANSIIRSVQQAAEVLFRPWKRTDEVVAASTTARSWMWGPDFLYAPMVEPYDDASGLTASSTEQTLSYQGDDLEWYGSYRLVTYFDKSRMEITHLDGDPNASWYVTNGLLAKELITGQMQLGDNTFEQHTPAEVQIAGDPGYTSAPSYATFNALMGYQPLPSGWQITQTINMGGPGQVGSNSWLANYGVTAVDVGAPTNHTVASVFWDFMNSSGLVYKDGQYVTDRLFENPFYATGYPISEAYWSLLPVNGSTKWVLIQAFERRVLTYTPDNPEGWQVEAGNVGQHYYAWRYGEGH